MKRYLNIRFALLSFCLQLIVVTVSLAQTTYTKETEARIKQVEQNLAGAVKVEGDPNWTLEERMAFHGIPGVSVAVISNYKLDWAKGYGWADKDQKRAVTTQTLFQAASISKSLNAVGVLKLVQEKKIDLNEDINKYLTSWKFPYDTVSHGKKITVANLLSHTAGLTIHGFPGYSRTDTLPTVIQILDGKKPANTKAVRSQFEPGLRVQYSGGGTTISQLLVMDVTQQSYDKYMYDNVLTPLGMTNSFYGRLSPKPLSLATAYTYDGKEVEGKYHIYPEQAAAALWTNPTDLSNYIIETQLAYQGKSSKVLSQQMTRARVTPFTGSGAGLGVFIDKKGDVEYFQHGGSNAGFRCQYFGSLDGGNGVVVMVNSDNGGIIDEIINSVGVVYKWKDFYNPTVKKIVAVPDDVLTSYVGEYQVGPQFTLVITKEGSALKVEPTGQGKFDLFAEATNKFFLKVVDAQLEFVKDANGKIHKLILHQNGRQMDGEKIK